MSENGNTEQREILVRRALEEFEARLIGYAASILREQDRARDVTQDTFIKLYAQDPEKVSEALKAWLFTVCRNRCLDILRKEKRMETIEQEQVVQIHDKTEDPSRQAERSDEQSEVMRFLERLPENQKEVLRLKFQGDMSYKEISEVTSLSGSNVGFLIHAGLKRMRGMLSHQTA